MSDILMYSDLSSALSMAAFSFVHGQKNVLKNSGFSLVSSVAARYVSQFLSGGAIDVATANMINLHMKDNIAVGLARAAIGMVAKEQHILLKSYDAVLCDILGEQLLVSLGIPDKGVFAATASTPPAPAPKTATR